MSQLLLSDKVQFIKGIGPERAKNLEKAGIFTINDLIRFFPRRHLDVSHQVSISETQEADMVTLVGNITRVSQRIGKGRKSMVEAFLHDGTGGVSLLWFNAPFMKDKLLKCGSGVFSGKITSFQGKKQLVNPLCQLDGEEGTTAGGVLPIYPSVDEFSQNQLRSLIRKVLNALGEELFDPFEKIILTEKFLSMKDSIEMIHFPKSEEEYEAARERFSFEEFLLFQGGLLVRKEGLVAGAKGMPISFSKKVDERIRERFSFTFTNGQAKVVEEINEDIAKSIPMNRMLQGDVGSGKTAVAIYFLLTVVANHGQGAFLAPTEVLATQHFLTLSKMLEGSKVNVQLLIGSLTAKVKKEISSQIQSGEVSIIVGTHALFSEGVEFNQLIGVVIDEQHRFGVMQRAKLIQKGHFPHVLLMSATPIPRTLALTTYGDLDVSIINELPPGRSPIRTFVIGENKRKKAYATIAHEVEEGHQAYIVCPLIEESEELPYQSALALFEELKANVFPEFKLGLLHGKIDMNEKDVIMQQFRRNEIQVLVATQVIEVGVDCPNATVLLIDGADRFGLAQLHQLRGRVGRGSLPGTCLLLSKKMNGPSFERLKIIENTTDGFEIAEADLQFRGGGEQFGIRQSGLPGFRLGHPVHDQKLMELARAWAQKIMYEKTNLVEKTFFEKFVVQVYGDKLSLGNIS